MTDKELLELAAKAAGIEIVDWYGDRYTARKIGDGLLFSFNPLTDDGDALRLAVSLCLTVEVGKELGASSEAYFFLPLDANPIAHGDDPYAATRRAIVFAAAEIGAGKTGEGS